MTDATVYLIEDDDTGRQATTLLLDVHDFKVSAFESAEQFLDAVPAPQGCIVADYRLPGMSGLQLFYELQSRRCNSPFVLISAHATEETLKEAISGGVHSFLQKPIPGERLIAAVKDSLSQYAPPE